MAFTEKNLTAPGPVLASGRHVKRYHIDRPGHEIEPEVAKAAYDLVPALLPEPDATTPPASWAVLHRGSDTGAYLVVYSWVWDNVVEARALTAGQPTLGCPDDNPAHFVELGKPIIGCVWELAVLEHERAAWVRHILSPARPDLDGYLSDLHPERPIGR
jgi:hypothetical protein